MRTCGHRAAGVLLRRAGITGALEHIADRVSHLVYRMRWCPPTAIARHHQRGRQPGRRDRARRRLAGAAAAADFDDPAEASWSPARRTAHPARCFSEPVRLARPLENYPFTRTYIKASAEPRAEPAEPFWAAADRARNSPAWRYREVATTHMIPSNRPDDLASLLTELAAVRP
jgi:hypothetical protein